MPLLRGILVDRDQEGVRITGGKHVDYTIAFLFDMSDDLGPNEKCIDC